MEKIIITSTSYDPENEIKNIKYNVYKTRWDEGAKLHYIKDINLVNGIKEVGNYEIEEIIEDWYGNIVKSTRDIEVVNKPPISSFSTDKDIYRDMEKIIITSTSYDPENEIKNIKYNVYKTRWDEGAKLHYIKDINLVNGIKEVGNTR